MPAPNNLGPRPGARKRANKLNTSGLGRSLVKNKETSYKNGMSSDRYTTEVSDEPKHVQLRSVTQERALDEFLSTAELAETDFTTERTANIRIIRNGEPQEAHAALTDAQKHELQQIHYENAGKLTVPRRPRWNKSMSAVELDRLEREAFLNWRRSLAELQENKDLLLTPFERNIQVWRQLWRVVERSELVVQIVDARNPLLFRSSDLENYVKELPGEKATLLLINKADLLNSKQREIWAKYFLENGIDFAFFSAKTALLDLNEEERADEHSTHEQEVASNTTTVLSVDQLEALFIASAPQKNEEGSHLEIGLVGYPNVGKSSTINALIGAKKVSVSSTPGKTKHFQTIKLSPEITICDCPGLVFPNFAQTNADLVVNGVLPIDQLREHLGPVQLVCKLIPKYFLQAVYGIRIHTKPIDEGGTGVPTANELLTSYARSRGYMRTGGGDPDTSRAARYILKDFVNGKLLHCTPPPDFEGEFNADKFELEFLPESRRHQLIEAITEAYGRNVDISSLDLAKELSHLKFSSYDTTKTAPKGPDTTGSELDREFFVESAQDGVARLPFHRSEAQNSGKKHFKGRKKHT